MRTFKIIPSCCLAAVLVLVGGCGDSADQTAEGTVADQPAETAKPRAGKLPPLAAAIGPLDGGRVSIAPPEGWHLPSRSSKWLIRFQESRRTAYPSIMLTVEDWQGLKDVSAENVDEFARQVAKAVAAEESAGSVVQPVKPITVGSLVGASYARQARIDMDPVDRQFVETVVDGRRYRLELRTKDQAAKKYRRYLLAVAAGLEFPQAESAEPVPDEPKPAEGEKPAEPPAAEEKPAPEEKPAEEEKPAAEEKPAPEEKPAAEEKPPAEPKAEAPAEEPPEEKPAEKPKPRKKPKIEYEGEF